MPYELSRRNFKNAQRVLEYTSTNLLSSLNSASKTASKAPSTSTASLEALDAMLSKMHTLKRKLETLHEEEVKIHKSAKARLKHLQDLHEVQSLVDVKYDEWSRTRLSRLLVDYLLREGYAASAAHLAQSKEITELVDVDAFVACHRIERSLREGMSTGLALEWCKEHGKELKKAGSMLEFELRLQQYIELVRQGHEAGMSGMESGDADAAMDGVSLGGAGSEGADEAKLVEARAHAKKYLSGNVDFDLLRRAAGLLAYRPWDQVEPYAVGRPVYSPFSTCTNHSYSLSTHPHAGLISPHSFSRPTTRFILSPLARSCTPLSPPAFLPSKHPHAIPHTPLLPPTHPHPPPPSARSAAPN